MVIKIKKTTKRRRVLDTCQLYVKVSQVMKSTIKIIRECIEKQGLSRYQISKRTGIDQTVLYRIVRGGDCMISTADKLLKLFGYEVCKKKITKKSRAKK
ncbi:MAG: helix-turn-helix transcriptional regulator [Sedimentisphaerales bacterium]|nr:helix-turn-helix transcriptional regulator [Sedimentisphaerales bacterium]